MKFNWLPWKYIISTVAKKHGFIDPISILSHLNKFSQPSEVAEPIELLRAGVIFHARGLINSRVIQHNLDWVWPYWIERQFNPLDISFVPRAFSITHVNLTHRNWTAVGIPDYPQLPLIDPRGLLTPLLDKWSIDVWIVNENNQQLIPSRSKNTEQILNHEDGACVTTNTTESGFSLTTKADVQLHQNSPICRLRINATSQMDAWLVVSLRPYNPEGISFINNIKMLKNGDTWLVNKKHQIFFDQPCDKHYLSTYNQGDVYSNLFKTRKTYTEHCDIGLATGAALFQIKKDNVRTVQLHVPLTSPSLSARNFYNNKASIVWKDCLKAKVKLSIPDKKLQYIYEASIKTLILCSPKEAFPGPYTYKRFWFRDAAFITCGLLYVGFIDRAEKSIQHFPKYQIHNGYFHSQEGEWDSNGQVLWILNRFLECTNKLPSNVDWWPSIKKGAHWIIKKRTDENENFMHSGLLPAGFSAEHLGPNDYYYWDDYWSVAGLQSASLLAKHCNEQDYIEYFSNEANSLLQSIERSLKKVTGRITTYATPASPYRRMDAGAIGSIASGYPLQLVKPNNKRLMNTVEFLLKRCFVNNGFFQDMIHSGINPYLTLHVAQILLRANDSRYFDLLQCVADLASPTGQWPEAVHPHTHGGCMGDGQHAWAAAEWVIMIRNCFIREEQNNLIIASGITQEWLESEEELSFGLAPTTFGNVSVRIQQNNNLIKVFWESYWWRQPDKIEIRLPGLPVAICDPLDSVFETTVSKLK